MEKRIPLTCHLAFNPRNKHHVQAAQVLATVRPKYKTTFIALAVAAYMEAHPAGIDMNELAAIQKDSRHSYQPKTCITGNRKKNKVQESEKRSEESREAIDTAMDFYDIG